MTKAQKMKRRRLLVTARLGGPSWWRWREDMRGTYWYWDGQDSWYAQSPEYKFGHSQFTPEFMLENSGMYILCDDPRKRKRRKK